MKTERDSRYDRIEHVILVLLRVVVGVVFVWASVDKILHPEQFARAVANYRILPQIVVNGFAITLPWIELVCGILLIFGQWQQSVSFVLGCLIAVFVVAVAWSVWRGLDIHCGCFDTASGRKIGMLLLVEDLLLLGGILFLFARSPDKLGKKAFFGGR